jgi:hypothetical protein
VAQSAKAASSQILGARSDVWLSARTETQAKYAKQTAARDFMCKSPFEWPKSCGPTYGIAKTKKKGPRLSRRLWSQQSLPIQDDDDWLNRRIGNPCAEQNSPSIRGEFKEPTKCDRAIESFTERFMAEQWLRYVGTKVAAFRYCGAH